MTFNFERRTPLIVHENVQGFVSELICEEAKKQGYECITLRAKPSDLGLPVNQIPQALLVATAVSRCLSAYWRAVGRAGN